MTTSPSDRANPSTPASTDTPDISWPDPARHAAFTQWLLTLEGPHSLQTHTLRPASTDASFRRYLRVQTEAGHSCIIMDAPPAHEDCAAFARVAQLMAQAGIRVPDILDWDCTHGFMLLSDLGTQTLLDAIGAGPASAWHHAYLNAVDILVRWQQASKPGVLPAYDHALLQRELSLFPDWYLQRHRGHSLTDSQQDQLSGLFECVVRHNLAAALVYVHRDFMPRNLMINPAGPTHDLGVLDFQDAVYGPITYDIASLMRDAFLSCEEDFVLDLTVRYWQRARQAGLPVPDDFGDFYRAVEWMGLQRHLKVLGIFARLTLRDGKPKYLADTPRFIGYVRATASRYRELTPLLRLLDQVEGTGTASGYAFGRL